MFPDARDRLLYIGVRMKYCRFCQGFFQKLEKKIAGVPLELEQNFIFMRERERKYHFHSNMATFPFFLP